MYHVAGTCISVSLFYFISFFLSRLGFYSVAVHRKIWNTVLAVTLLFAGLAGIFMALQINYKWSIPFIRQLLRWHVETGVAGILISIFHLSWHLSYYGKLFSKRNEETGPGQEYFLTKDDIISALFVAGFTSTSVQVLLIREMMNITGGYELIAGVFLGSWLIASAAGAVAAGSSGLNDLKKSSLTFTLSPFVSLATMFLFSNFFLEKGETPSFLMSLIFTLSVLLPYCFISGFYFIKLSASATGSGQLTSGRAYSVETAGSAIAGILISVLATGVLSNYKLFLVITLMALAYTLINFFSRNKSPGLLIRIIFLALITLTIISNPDRLLRQILLPGLQVTDTRDTPYGNITRGTYSASPALYYNQRLLSFSNDVIQREEDVHYVMLQREKVKNVSVISGNIRSLVIEIKKYKINRITFLERDPGLISEELRGFSDLPGELHIENEDAFRYFRNENFISDVVISLVPPPSTLSLNRYFTRDFFLVVKSRLSTGGIFLCSPGPGDDYLNDESVKLYSSVYASLSDVFRHVKPVNGHKLYFLASDDDISVDFCKLVQKRGINNMYVGPDYLSDELTESKSEEIEAALIRNAGKNTAAKPVASFHFQAYNLSMNLGEKYPALIMMVLLFVVPALFTGRKNATMYLTAFSLAGFEIIMLLMLQLTAGNMYRLSGAFLAVMMTGLAAGSMAGIKAPGWVTTRRLAFALSIYYLLTGMVISIIPAMKHTLAATILIMISTLPPSVFTGYLFRKMTGDGKSAGVSAVYSSDLAGSALGFIIVSGIAIPLAGMKTSMLLLSLVIFTGFLFASKKNK